VKRLDKATQVGAPPGTLVRDRLTLVLYAALGMLGFLLNGIGAVLAPLQEQLGVSRAEVAFYPSLFAVALVSPDCWVAPSSGGSATGSGSSPPSPGRSPARCCSRPRCGSSR
jgi:hypothetical protein